jgi:hypothetical protein
VAPRAARPGARPPLPRAPTPTDGVRACAAGRRRRPRDGGGRVEERLGGRDGGLEVPGQPPVAADPGEEAFDHPAPGVDREADLSLRLADDLDADGAGAGDPLPGVAAVRVAEFDEGPAAARRAEQRQRPVAVLHAARMGVQDQPAPVGVHHRVALAAHDLLARVVAARSAALGRPHALGVDHRRRRARPAPGALAVEHDEMVVQALQHAAVAQAREPAVDRPPRREALRQQAPRTARAQHVEDRVHDLPHRPRPAPSPTRGGRKQRPEDAPLCVGHVAHVAQARAVMLPPGARGPRRPPCAPDRRPVEARPAPATHPGQVVPTAFRGGL